MNYKDKIISDIAESACKIITKKVIRKLQQSKDMLSGDDTTLKNVWDEICVQVQGEESLMWDAYLDTISSFIEHEVSYLDDFTQQAIWLQTNEGSNWDEDNEEDYDYKENYRKKNTIFICHDDIVLYILNDYILSSAADWSNKRIREYLEIGGDYF